MKMRRRNLPFEYKVIEDTGAFAGYGSVFGTVDSYNEVVAPGAFKDSLAKHEADGSTPAMLWQHRAGEPIGSYPKMSEDGRGLYVEGQLALGVRQADEARILMRMDPPAIRGLSIGYIPQKEKVDRDTGIVTLTQVDLWEVSLVTFPANADAQVESVRAALMGDEVPSPREVEMILRDAGFSKRQAKGLIAQGYRGFVRRDADTDGSRCDAGESLEEKLFELMKERGYLQ